MERPLVSIVILNYNGKQHTLELLNSLRKTTYDNYEIIVVDNGSTDCSTEAIRESFASARVVENGENLGYSRGMNEGIRKSRGEYVVLLNNDMVVDPNWLEELVKVANLDKSIGVVGPMLLEYAAPEKIQYVGHVVTNQLLLFLAEFARIGEGERDCGQYSRPIKVAYTNGLIKKALMNRIGMLDEKMFVYYEETDFCFRAIKAGFRVVVAPRSKIWHKKSATIEKGTQFVIYEYYKNKLRYILKNYKMTDKVLAMALNLLYFSYMLLLYSVRGKRKSGSSLFWAIRWNIKNRKDYHL